MSCHRHGYTLPVDPCILTPISAFQMPRNNRAGRKHQARFLLRQLYRERTFDPSVFETNALKDIDLSLPYKLIPITLPEKRPYKLYPITTDPLPSLPQGDIVSVPEDPRPEFYSLYRKALLHYFYGGSTPQTRYSPTVWPSYTSDIEIVRKLTRNILQDIKVITID